MGKFGYGDDERVHKAIKFTLYEACWGVRYLYAKSYVKAATKSCIRSSQNVLLLFADLPKLWDTQECQNLIEYFLDRKVFYKRNNHTEFVHGYSQTYFPFHYRAGVLEPLYALSKMGYGNHTALTEAWGFLTKKKEEAGRFILDRTMPRRKILASGGTGRNHMVGYANRCVAKIFSDKNRLVDYTLE